MTELVIPQDTPTTAAEEKIAVATQWQLMWWRFRKHKLAMLGSLVLIVFYLSVISGDFLAYADPNESDAQRGLIAPQTIEWFDNGEFKPYMHPLKGTRSENVQAGLCAGYGYQIAGEIVWARISL